MERYIRKVFYSDEDECWIAVAPELEGCSALGDTDTEALKELDVVIKGHLEIRKERGWSIPKPLTDRVPRGKFLLRLPRSLQAQLAEDATEEGVSLNQYMVYLLGEGKRKVGAYLSGGRRASLTGPMPARKNAGRGR